MKHKTLLFTLILLLAICFSVVNTTTDAGVKTFSATNSYYEVKPGQTFSLKINGVKANNLKWASSQPSYIKVNKNSKFKALKNGTSILSTKYKGIKYSVTVNICDSPMDVITLRKKYNDSEKSLTWYENWYKENLNKVINYEIYEEQTKTLIAENSKLKSEVQALKDSLPPVVEKKEINQLLFANTYLEIYFDRIQDGEIHLKYVCKNTDMIRPILDYVKINETVYYHVPGIGNNIFKDADYDYTLKVQDNDYNSVDYNFSSGTFSGKGHYTDKNYETVYFDFNTTIE